jgi:hypothetical protein
MNRNLTALFALGIASIACLIGLTTDAQAGERTPLSSIPARAAVRDGAVTKAGVPGLTVKRVTGMQNPNYFELNSATAAGYCLVSTDPSGLSLQETAYSDTLQHELWRLSERDGVTTLEQTRFAVDVTEPVASLKSRSSIALRSVGSTNGVEVFSFREPNGDVVLLARSATSGREQGYEKEVGWGTRFVSSSCTFGGARLPAALAKNGATARLHGAIPAVGTKTKKDFVVDASLVKTGRDPEPLLALRVRLVDS